MSETYQFRSYTKAELKADAVVHYAGVPLGWLAAILLLARAAPQGGWVLASVVIYGIGLVGMLSASAAYQLWAPSLTKERLRRIDKAMIFVMIAGTYTPISATALRGHFGGMLCLVLWGVAAIGVFLTLRYPRRFEPILFCVYLGMGWMMVLILRDCIMLLPPMVLWLLVAGGLIYTAGAAVRATRMKFHNPVWHGMILLAAGLQYAAIALQLTGRVI